MKFQRGSGILLHPSSLPGEFGIGDFGSAATEFVDFLAAAGQSYWQILPLSPTGHGNSPYSSYSAFAGNTLLISPEKLFDDGLVTELSGVPNFLPSRVDYPQICGWKAGILAEAFEKFRANANPETADEFNFFTHSNAWWLDDYAIFRALKATHGQKPWYEWAEPLKLRDTAALDTVRSQLSRKIEAEKFYQYLFFSQWLGVRRYANDKGIKIIGDIPIFVALDSADVWCNRSGFKLDDDGMPKVVAGVPPDYFSTTGQMWGNPIYDWHAMIDGNFDWWTARIAFALMTVDIIRLDHFIGFVRNWEIPYGDKTAENGGWVDVPGQRLFTVLKHRLGDLPIIAEDLGALTPEVEALRDEFRFPGMRILQYAFGGDARNRDLPHNYVQNCVAYTGTHDNDTTAGWYKSVPGKVRSHCRKYLPSNGRQPHWDMIDAAMSSVADLAIIPAQDILGLLSDARMNTPATGSGNWEWRLPEGALTESVCDRLKKMTELYGRDQE